MHATHGDADNRLVTQTDGNTNAGSRSHPGTRDGPGLQANGGAGMDQCSRDGNSTRPQLMVLALTEHLYKKRASAPAQVTSPALLSGPVNLTWECKSKLPFDWPGL